MRRKSSRIVLPVSQRGSQGWAVQWRRGNAHRDTYELVYRGQREGGVVVTGEGWKWYRTEFRGLRFFRGFSAETFPTWEEAVTALARRFRRTARGRGAAMPTEWITLVRPRPWTPRPIHPDFATYFAASRESS